MRRVWKTAKWVPWAVIVLVGGRKSWIRFFFNLLKVHRVFGILFRPSPRGSAAAVVTDVTYPAHRRAALENERNAPQEDFFFLFITRHQHRLLHWYKKEKERVETSMPRRIPDCATTGGGIGGDLRRQTEVQNYSSFSSASWSAMLKYLNSYTLLSLLEAITRSQSRTLCFFRYFLVKYFKYLFEKGSSAWTVIFAFSRETYEYFF